MSMALREDALEAANVQFYPFCTSALSTSVYVEGSAADPPTERTLYGNIIDLHSYPGYGSLSCIVGARSLITAASDDGYVKAYFEACSSASFTNNSTAFGSTGTLYLFPSSGTSTEEGVCMVTVSLRDAVALRYVRARVLVLASSGDGDYVTVCPIYAFGGKDDSPATHNVQIDGQSSEVAS